MRDSCDGSASACAAHKAVEESMSLPVDFWSGGEIVYLFVFKVLELIGEIGLMFVGVSLGQVEEVIFINNGHWGHLNYVCFECF